MFLSIEKTEKEFVNGCKFDVNTGAMKLNINKEYKRKVYNIIINLLKENEYIVDGVKEKMVAEQKKNISKYYIKLRVKRAIVMAYNNNTDDDADTFEDDDEYNEDDYKSREDLSEKEACRLLSKFSKIRL